MDYNQTIAFMYSQLPAYHRIGKAAYKNDLENSLALDKYFGHPHFKYKCIHVAGTNGKGSVSHMIASVLQEAGYSTGLYTSPHLKDFRERIRIDGRMIPKREVTLFIRKHNAVIASLKPSFFEMTVALAFDYYARAGVDIAVIEVGLGGRLDSTNIISPELSVITNIGHDHADLLGDTILKIAGEKAGIIKPGVPVVVSETQDEISNVFISAAQQKKSDIRFADQEFECRLDDLNYSKGKRKYSVLEKSTGCSFTGETNLGGDYQAKNIQAVFQSIRMLQEIIPCSDMNIINGIRRTVGNTGLMGRWQIVGRKPLVVCDTGHNLEGLSYVLSQLKSTAGEELHIVIGFVDDKDRGSVLPLFPSEADYFFTRASVPRALDERVLMAEALRWNLKGNAYPDVRSAVRSALDVASENDVVFIGGSTFVVADALKNCKFEK
ncbi:MAG: bifunctional folylpolyglutamate synthase/dihydrofolate synthase [Bacteroidales bacterium]|nr:bifunctional folylpolyglutamate synthase/dihydrofolate synthase [Bacteroidales bacterium]